MTEAYDPTGLIREAFRMEGITEPECRTIFLDWALGVPKTVEVTQAVTALLTTYADAPADHPMTATLKAALSETGPAKRRGGRKGRMQA